MSRILRIRVTLLAAAVAVLLAGPAAAQEPDAPRDLLRLRQACARRMVRVLSSSSETVLGRCGPVEDARLVVQDTAGRVRELPYRTVAGVWVRRSGARQGAIAGGVVAGTVAAVWVGARHPDPVLRRRGIAVRRRHRPRQPGRGGDRRAGGRRGRRRHRQHDAGVGAGVSLTQSGFHCPPVLSF